MQTGRASRGRGVWPLAAICCLGCILLAIAAVIVVALIPIYLPQKSISVASPSTSPFYLQYSAPANANSSISGSITNLAALSKALGIPVSVLVANGYSRASISRRKRNLINRRQKRNLFVYILLVCTYQPVKICDVTCIAKRKRIQSNLATNSTISNVTIVINSDGLIEISTFTLTFIGLTTIRPAGFLGAASSTTFVAIQSGAFNDLATWSGGIVPYFQCTVIIPAGITVTYARSTLEIELIAAIIYGRFILGTGSSTFKFNFPINLNVQSGGIIQDDTTNKMLLVPALSIITVYPGGGFAAPGTVIQAYSSAGVGNSVTIPSASGPFTIGILSTTNILLFNTVTFIAIQSGTFTSTSTYLGGMAPSVSGCAGSGCDVYIVSGVTLSTADLNGVMNIMINTITVSVGATLQLGTPGSSSGFKFMHPIQLSSSGTVAFVGSGSGIFLVSGSTFDLLAGSTFTSVIVTFLQVFNPITGVIIGAPFSISSSVTIPFYFIVAADGTYTVDGTTGGPNTNTAPTFMGG